MQWELEPCSAPQLTNFTAKGGQWVETVPRDPNREMAFSLSCHVFHTSIHSHCVLSHLKAHFPALLLASETFTHTVSSHKVAPKPTFVNGTLKTRTWDSLAFFPPFTGTFRVPFHTSKWEPAQCPVQFPGSQGGQNLSLSSPRSPPRVVEKAAFPPPKWCSQLTSKPNLLSPLSCLLGSLLSFSPVLFVEHES